MFTTSERTIHYVDSDGRTQTRHEGSASHSYRDKVLGSSELVLDTSGGSVTVPTANAWFASMRERREQIDDAGTGHRDATSASSSKRVFADRAWTEPGDPVLVLGDLTAGRQSDRTIISAEPGTSPRLALAREVVHQLVTFGGLAALSLTGLVLWFLS